MSAIASNTAQILEDDPRLKLVASFLSDVLHIENVNELAFSVLSSEPGLFMFSMRPEWTITVNLPGVERKIVFVVMQILGVHQISSVAFFPGWQPSAEDSQS